MTPQEVFDNWSAYLRPVDRADFLEALKSIVRSESKRIMELEAEVARLRDKVLTMPQFMKDGEE